MRIYIRDTALSAESTSKAGVKGISIFDNLKRNSWTQEPTWQMFYNKQTEVEK